MEDSFGERVWIDRPECKQFVDNIQTAFNTKIPKVSLSTDPLKQEAASGKINLLANRDITVPEIPELLFMFLPCCLI